MNRPIGISDSPTLDAPLGLDKAGRKSQEMKVLANGNVMKLQKSRQRRILSCIHCHSKKIKCSRVQPVCDNCQKVGIECKYFSNKRMSRGGRRRSATAQNPPKRTDSITSELPVKTENHSLDPHESSSATDYSEMHRMPSLDSDKLMSPDEKLDPVSYSQDPSLDFMGMAAKVKELSPTARGNFSSLESASISSLSVLQAPVPNSVSNNMTNNFFNTNYASNNKQKSAPCDDLYSFNMSSFTFTSAHAPSFASPSVKGALSSHGNLGKIETVVESIPSDMSATFLESKSTTSTNEGLKPNNKCQTTNFVDGPRRAPPVMGNLPPKVSSVTTFGQAGDISDTEASSLNNPGLKNSLTAFPSNPATTMNYLYGTNTHYESLSLLSDLIDHLPSSRERSLELLDRYLNSVHILFPVMVNLHEFIKEHDRFWDKFDPQKTHSSSTPEYVDDFNLLQFYTLYFPILYASTISEFEEYDNLLLNQDVNKYLKGFNRICQYYNYPHGLKSIPLLLGNVIIQSTSPNPSTMEMSQIIRYAKFLQLHKDPATHLKITDWKIVRFRRMLWWVIFGLDALSSHNFCLPPVCRYEDVDVELPDAEDPIFDSSGHLTHKQLNVTILSMTIKFKYDRILSDLVNQLHNALSLNITEEEIQRIKSMIIDLFHYIHKSILKMNEFFQINPPSTVQEMNLLNFVKNHSWSYVDRSMMLLHKKILLNDPKGSKKSFERESNVLAMSFRKDRNGCLALSEYEDTFGRLQENNIIANFDNLPLSQLRFNQHELFTYENMDNNLIPSILHNLNDFLKYNDFIKFGKFNWFIKRTIPLDSIILLFIIISVKFKYNFMTLNELVIYVNLINKSLYILNRKYFKNEKYKRMLSLTNCTWEFILKKFNVVRVMNAINHKKGTKIECFDFQVNGYMNMSELFDVMDVPQPALIHNGENIGIAKTDVSGSSFGDSSNKWKSELGLNDDKLSQTLFFNVLLHLNEKQSEADLQGQKLELLQLNEKIYYDLRNNFVDIIDYCTFYSSLENVLHELMDYINSGSQSNLVKN